MTRPTYQVTARRWPQGWELHIVDVGVTQCYTLAGADYMARDYVSLRLDIPADSFDLEMHAELAGELLGATATRELAGLERPRGRWLRLLDAVRGYTAR